MTVALIIVLAVAALMVAALAVVVYLGAVTGALTVDTGSGRRIRRLGPLSLDIAADRDLVYTLLTQPYLGRATRALAEKVTVLERGADMVLAAHRTPIRGRLVAVTVETVRFTPGEQVDFRLLRGPVPHVVEQFTLSQNDAGTRLDYHGELGTDFGALGGWWGAIVARRWEAAVDATMQAVKAEAERQAARPPLASGLALAAVLSRCRRQPPLHAAHWRAATTTPGRGQSAGADLDRRVLRRFLRYSGRWR